MSVSNSDSELAAFLQLVRDSQITNFVVLSAFVVLVYDAIISFSEIVRQAKISTVISEPSLRESLAGARLERAMEQGENILYPKPISHNYRDNYFAAWNKQFVYWTSILTFVSSAWSMLIFILPAQLVLIFRTLALWGNNRTMSVFCFSVTAISDLVIVASIILVDRSTQFETPVFTLSSIGCVNKIKSISLPVVIPACAALMLFDTFIFIVTLQKLRVYLTKQNTKGRIAKILFRDGIIFYLVMLASSAANLVTYATLPPTRRGLTGALIPVLRTVMNVCTNHLHLNLRGTIPQSGLNIINLPSECYDNRNGERSAAGTPSALRFRHSDSEVGMPDTPPMLIAGEDGAPALQADDRSWASTMHANDVKLSMAQPSSDAENEGQDVISADLGLQAKGESAPGVQKTRVRRLTGTNELERVQRGTRMRRRTLYGGVRPPSDSGDSGLMDGKIVGNGQ